MADALTIQSFLEFDYYFYTFLDPLQTLTQTLSLYCMASSPAIPNLLKFSLSRILGVSVRLAYVVVHHLLRRLSLNFWTLRRIHDPHLKADYLVHPSAKAFQRTFGVSTLIFFVSSNFERVLQVHYYSLEQLGLFSFIQSTVDNLWLLTCQPLSDFLGNFFNLKMSLFHAADDVPLRAGLLAEVRSMYLHSVKYILLFFQLFVLYGSFVLLDHSALGLLGSNYGRPEVALALCGALVMSGLTCLSSTNESLLSATLRSKNLGLVNLVHLVNCMCPHQHPRRPPLRPRPLRLPGPRLRLRFPEGAFTRPSPPSTGRSPSTS